MRQINLLSLLFVVSFSSCGQKPYKDVKISSADQEKINSYERKSVFYQNSMPDSAIYYVEKGLKLSRSLHYRKGEGIMLNEFANINEQYGNLKLAAKHQSAALTIFKSLHEFKFAAGASTKLGLIEAKLGNYDKGLKLSGDALAQYKKMKDTTGMITANTSLGEIYELSGKPDQAMSYYSEAMGMNKGKMVTDKYFDLIGSVGKLQVKMGKPEKALGYYLDGIDKSGNSRHARSSISLLNQAGKAAAALGDKDKALAYHQQSLQKARAQGLYEEQARSLMSIAAVLKDEDAEQSIVHLKNALAIARNIGHKGLSAEIYSSLSNIYKQQAKYESALNAIEAHHRLLDSMLIVNKGHKIAVLQSSYDLAESRLDIETLKLANKEKTYQRNLSLLSALTAIIVLIILAFYFYRTARLNKRLKESNQIKDKLFSIIGHDLRNPIGGITQLLAIMDEEKLDQEAYKGMVSEMRKQGDVSLEILNALLNWGEAQLKGVHVKPVNFKAEAIIAKNITALHTQANAKSILITDHTSSDINVYGDINHFDFIIRNLLSNAIKFSLPSGKVEIMANTDVKADQVVFSVRDYGKGINKEQQALFLKANMDIAFGTAGEKGTGIGLMLCKEFVRANNGKMWLESEEGKGTVFYFSFPKANS